MAVRKVIFVLIAVIAIIVLLIVSRRNQQQEIAPKAEINFEAEAVMRQMTKDVLYQDSILRRIDLELEKIDSLYITYEVNVELNRSNPDQATDIIQRIRNLHESITAIQQEMTNVSIENKGLFGLIERIQKELSEKEARIVALQQTVEQQAEELVLKEKVIVDLQAQTTEQADDLLQMQAEIEQVKARAFKELADLLYQTAVEMPQVKGLFTRRSKNNLEELKERLIKEAFQYYDKAAEAGSSGAAIKKRELAINHDFLH